MSFPTFENPRIFPAIDLRGGRCVRLVRGARDSEMQYDGDPVDVARKWLDAGAECLHVIDLGAAFKEDSSAEVVLEIARQVPLPVQTGGGIRDDDAVARLLDGGVGRVILGTRALADTEFLARVIERHGPERVVVAVDCEGDRVKTAGWEADSPLTIEDTIAQVEGAGADRFLVTATDRDGTFGGLRVDLVKRVLDASSARVVAAGGVGNIDHVKACLALDHERLEGVVIGRALYEGGVDLAEAIALTV